MRRRKLLIGIGAAAAGGSAAFGTEAFTSVQAERNVDVAVAGDQSSFLALEATDSANAGTYVNIESSDSTLEIILDGEGQQDGGGVAQDAITKLDDLFKILNQGSQAVNVYFQDDSDAVTFRSNGSPIEGAANSVELGVGEQMVVSLTVDTLNNDMSTDSTLLDTATIFAQADDPSPGGEAPVTEFNRIVNSAQVSSGSSEGRYYADLRTALDEATPGDNIGLEEDITLPADSGTLSIDVDDVTLASVDPTSQQNIQLGSTRDNNSGAPNGGGNAVEISADGASLQSVNLEAEYDSTVSGSNELLVSGDSANVSDISLTRTYGGNNGSPAIYVSGTEVTVRNNTLGTSSNGSGPIAFGSGSVEIVNNVIQNTTEEGIWCFGSNVAESDVTIRGNQITNIDTNRSSDGKAVVQPHIKLVTTPTTVNGQSNIDDKFNALLTENNNTGDGEEFRVAIGNDPIDTKQNIGVIVDSSDPAEAYADIQTGIDEAGPNGYVLVRDGEYAGAQVRAQGVTVESADGTRPKIDASVGKAQSGRVVNSKSDGATIRGFKIVGTDNSLSGEVGVTVTTSNGLVEDIVASNVLTGVQFSSGSSSNTARQVTVKTAQVGVSPAGGTGHVVEQCDFTDLTSGDFSNAPEGVGAAGAVDSRNNNYGDGVFLRSYSSETVTSDEDFFGSDGEDGEVVTNDGDTPSQDNVTVSNVKTSKNPDAGAKNP